MSTHQLLLQASVKNVELLQGLNQTEYAASALQQTKAYVSDLDKEISQCDRQIKELELKTHKERADHKRYAESTMRRFMYRAGGKRESFQEKASKEEREYVEALNAEMQAKNRRDKWRHNRDMAKQSYAELECIEKTHTRLQAELDALYNSIFAGPTPDIPGDDRHELEFRDARDDFNAVKQRHEAEIQAFKCLQEADRFMQEALSALAYARSHSQMDMFGGGSITDMMERHALSRAQGATDKVHMLVLQAQRIVPGTRGLGPTNIAQGHLTDVFFDNIFSDMAMHDEIKRSQSQCEQEARNLQGLVATAEARSRQLGQEASHALDHLENCRRQLQRFRSDAFEKASNPPSYEQSTTDSGNGLNTP